MKEIKNCNPCPICGCTTIKIMKMPRKEILLDGYCTFCGFYVMGDTEKEILDRWNRIDAKKLEADYLKWLKSFEKGNTNGRSDT